MRPAKRELRRERITAALTKLRARLTAAPKHANAAGWRQRVAEYEAAIEAEVLEARAAEIRARGRKGVTAKPGTAAAKTGGD